MPGNPESLFEIGFILFKRSSIFMVCFIIIFNSLGLMLIYFIVFGDTLSSVIRTTTSLDDSNFFTTKPCYIIIITALLIPLVLKKEL